MLFLSALVAPTAFRALPAESAGAFVRTIFPSYFLVNGVAGVIAAALAFGTLPGALLFVGGIALIALRFIVVPAVNRARDRMLAGDAAAKSAFARWHRLSVVVNVAAIVLYAVAIWVLDARLA